MPSKRRIGALTSVRRIRKLGGSPRAFNMARKRGLRGATAVSAALSDKAYASRKGRKRPRRK